MSDLDSEETLPLSTNAFEDDTFSFEDNSSSDMMALHVVFFRFLEECEGKNPNCTSVNKSAVLSVREGSPSGEPEVLSEQTLIDNEPGGGGANLFSL